MAPRARSRDLIVESAGEELVVYDEREKTAHRLNAVASRVWKVCDGRTSVREIAAMVDLGADCDDPDAAVELTLRDLFDAALLEEGSWKPADDSGLTRRKALALAVGVGAALLVPTVTSMVAPTPAMATSPDGDDVIFF